MPYSLKDQLILAYGLANLHPKFFPSKVIGKGQQVSG